MTKVYELPTQDAFYDDASLWIARLDEGLSPGQEKALGEWLAENKVHREVLFEMADLWDRMDSLSRLSTLFPAPRARKTRSKPFYFAAAASLFLALLGGMMTITVLSPEGTSGAWWMAWNTGAVDGTYDTGVGEHSRVNLPDGTQLVLNTNSKVSVSYTREERLFHLDRGEIHIQVAHDKTRPLNVIANGKVVQAVGTAFNVQIVNEREVELIVTDGKVLVGESDPALTKRNKNKKQVNLKSDAVSVSKGEKLMLGAQDAAVSKIDASEIEVNLSWREGNIVFRGESLEDALAEITRYTEVKFELADDEMKDVRIAGMFKAGDIKGLLDTLEQNFDIEHKRLDRHLIQLRHPQS